jgi:hypothetical protein
VLKTLPTSYKHRATTIEEIQTMTNLTKDMLVDKLKTFELSEFGDYFRKTEFAFKATTSEKGKLRHDPNESSSKYVSM